MKSLFVRFALAAGLLALGLVGLIVASELQEVVVLTTLGSQGERFETRLWVVDDDGAVWLRSTDVKRAWYQRVRQHPEVELERGGERRAYRASLGHGEATRLRIDRLMREKYGQTDAMIALLEGSPAGIPVRLDGRNVPAAD